MKSCFYTLLWFFKQYIEVATFTEVPGEVSTFRVTATDNGGGPAGSPGQFRLCRNCCLLGSGLSPSAKWRWSVRGGPRPKYYYHGGQRVAQRRRTPLGEDVVTYLHPDHPSTGPSAGSG